MTSLPELARKWIRKSEIGKGFMLSPAEQDLLNSLGIGQIIANAAAEYQREQCRQRDAHRRSTSVDRIALTDAAGGKTSSSPGMIPPPSANDQLQRAREMCGRGAKN